MPHLPSVAIVDDDQGVRGSLDSLLRSVGFLSVTFASGEELLLGDPDRFDWIITDVHMDGMSGLELQSEMMRRGCDCAIVVMTAHPTEAARARALSEGAVAFLTKPVDPDQLLDVIGV